MRPPIDVLAVDDEPALLGAVGKILRSNGLAVELAQNADEALGKLRSTIYGLVLCDLMLPGVDGIELMRAARRGAGDLPVVMITGYATLENAVDSFAGGAFDFLPKPFDEDELLAVVRRALGFSGLPDPRRASVGLEEFAQQRRHELSRPAALYALGRHAWASLESGGTAAIGIGESFRGLHGAFRDVETLSVGEETMQGNECARLMTEDGLAHRVWAPLSGRILESNSAWKQAPPAGDRLAAQWLVRIVPVNCEEELRNLTRR